jgi:glycerol-3-phosphate acyltransferase PlsY
MMATAVGLVVLAYLVGGVPFGYLVGRARGVNLRTAGSGNIGATNAGRVLGRPFAVLVFVLDFAKGAVPTALALPVADALGVARAFGPAEVLLVAVAAAAFLGHVFPVYLRFRGGKGVATGAGVAAALAPGPFALAALAWVTVALASRYVALASLAAAVTLVAGRLALSPNDSTRGTMVVTAFIAVGALLVVVRHVSNVRRLIAGTENHMVPTPHLDNARRSLHLLAAGLWFGGSLFFNFFAAPAIFASFKAVVAESPSDRTAMVEIVPPGTPTETRDALASALAGAAVGPVFPRYFGIQLVCGLVTLVTALAWVRRGRLHRTRALIAGVGVAIVGASIPVSWEVSRLRVERFDAEPGIAATAKGQFGPVHLVSLALSGVTVLVAGSVLGLGARLPEQAASPDVM